MQMNQKRAQSILSLINLLLMHSYAIRHLYCFNLAQKTLQFWSINAFYKETKKEDEYEPETAGVNTPSPISMQQPSNAKINKTFCKNLDFSNKALIQDARLDPEAGPTSSPFLYAESSSSIIWPLGNNPILAWRQIKE